MRAKIMLLPGSIPGEMLCSFAQQILTDVSASFNHSFSLLREKIGEPSRAAYGDALTEETVEACQACQAIFLGDCECEGVPDLYDALELPLRIRSFCIPDSVCGRHESPITLWLGQTLSVDAQTLRSAAKSAFRFAQEAETGVIHIAPTGASKAEWEAAMRVQEVAFPRLSVSSCSAAEAITQLVTNPARLGLMLCPPYAGGIFHAAATALCPHPAMMHDIAFDEHIGVYAPYVPKDPEISMALSPAATALSLAKMLRYSLGLALEAGCVEAAVNNVLATGWRTPGEAPPDPQTMVNLICEQITVAGELMGKINLFKD